MSKARVGDEGKVYDNLGPTTGCNVVGILMRYDAQLNTFHSVHPCLSFFSAAKLMIMSVC